MSQAGVTDGVAGNGAAQANGAAQVNGAAQARRRQSAHQSRFPTREGCCSSRPCTSGASEFDQVIVATHKREVYKADGISRRRLYTTVACDIM